LRNSKKLLYIVGAIALLLLGIGAILPPVRTEVIVLDALVPATDRLEVQARLVRGRFTGFLRAVSDGKVSFTVDGGGAGTATTDRRGVASVVLPMNDPGPYLVQAVGSIEGEEGTAPAFGLVRVQHHRQRILAVDLDGPLAAGSWLRAYFKGSDTLMAVPEAAPTLESLSRTFAIVYLTNRDEDQSNATKAWLEGHGFPRGPVFFSRALHDPFQLGRHVPRVVRHIKRNFPLFDVGIGDTAGEAKTFLAEGVKAFVFGTEGDLPDGARAFAAWESFPAILSAAR